MNNLNSVKYNKENLVERKPNFPSLKACKGNKKTFERENLDFVKDIPENLRPKREVEEIRKRNVDYRRRNKAFGTKNMSFCGQESQKLTKYSFGCAKFSVPSSFQKNSKFSKTKLISKKSVNSSVKMREFMTNHKFQLEKSREKTGKLLNKKELSTNTITIMHDKEKSFKESTIDHNLNYSDSNSGNFERIYKTYRNNLDITNQKCSQKYLKSNCKIQKILSGYLNSSKSQNISCSTSQASLSQNLRSFHSRNNDSCRAHLRPKSSFVGHPKLWQPNLPQRIGQGSGSVDESDLRDTHHKKLNAASINLDRQDIHDMYGIRARSCIDQRNEDSRTDELLRKLSPQQRQEIFRIREEGKHRCKQILHQIGEIKSKTSEKALETSSRRSQSQSEEYMKSIAGNYQEILKSLSNNEVSAKLEGYEARMKTFQTEIQNIQADISQQSLLLNKKMSQNYALNSSSQKWPTSVNESDVVYRKRVLDNSENFNAKESIIIQNSSLSKYNSCGTLEPRFSEEKMNNGKTKLHRKNASRSSICAISTLKDVQPSPVRQEDFINNSGKKVQTDLRSSYISNKSNPYSKKLVDQSQVLCDEEIKIYEMEIELLVKKLKYYQTQLQHLGDEVTSDWELMIQTIQRQLEEKENELIQKKNIKHTSQAQHHPKTCFNYQFNSSQRLSITKTTKNRPNHQPINLHILPKAHTPHLSPLNESATSLTSIPNEHTPHPQAHVQLSTLLTTHQIHSKPTVNFRGSPVQDPPTSSQEGGSPSQSLYVERKKRYEGLKESKRFYEKNCFNRDK
ncbi:unnamed protein product [Moneuplotes crassus]|uniref:Uncharacterized protein n=1 Tax=Euplotes crassus TaxID=5936 RepID=A0AAD2DB87_EUPCR|nr:unnamed protein product [Moneuplotes crassus]